MTTSSSHPAEPCKTLPRIYADARGFRLAVLGELAALAVGPTSILQLSPARNDFV